MLRNVYLEGELGTRFGEEYQIQAPAPVEVFRCLEGNFPDFKQYMIDCADKGVDFHIEVGGEELGKEEELLLTLGEGDIIITPVPAGSKSGGAKILAAVAIIAFIYFAPVIAGAGGYTSISAAAGAGGFAGTAYTVGMALAINLALTGIQQLMAPDPSVDSQADESYLFNGGAQNIVEGDPVPVLYGRLRVPGKPISFEVLNRRFTGASETGASTSDYVSLFGTGSPYTGTSITF